jgi:hypothetical protein
LPKQAQAALDVIRNRLQVIMLRAETGEKPAYCDTCALAVSEIIKELRALDTFIQSLEAHSDNS